MRFGRSALGAMLLLMSGGLVVAAESGRFEMHQTPDGIIRFDSETGRISECVRVEGRWKCGDEDAQAGSVDVTGLQEKVQRLEKELAKFKADEQARLEGFGGNDQAPSGKVQLPSDDDVDQVLGLVERSIRKFKDMLQSLAESRDGTQL